MPTVPTYDSAQVSQNTTPQVSFDATSAQPTAARQLMQTGQAMSSMGQAAGRIANDMQQQANDLRVTDALNQAKEQAMRLTFDKDAGFTNQRGINALQRQDGKSLEQEYSEELQKQMDSLANGLGNEAQRAMFKQNADGILGGFRANLVKHEAEQYQDYSLSVSEGVQSTALREIGLNWNSPEVIDKAVNRIKAETYRQGQLLGKSAEWQDARTRELTSKAHLTAMAAALDKGDPIYADGYLKKYGEQMQADDLLRARGLVNKEVDLQVGTSIGQATMNKYRSGIVPTEYDRLQNIVNSKAPQVEGQPALDEQIKKFGGDVTKALAAYKLGDKEVSSLEKQYGADWLANAPKDTRDFVTSTAAEFGAGGGKGTRPTLAEMKADLRNDPALANNPLRLKHAEDYIETQYAAINAAKKQREEDSLDAAYKELYANGGDMSSLPAGLRAQIPGDKLDSVLNFAKSVSKGEKMVNNGQAWAQVLSMPKSVLSQMTPTDFYAKYRNVLDDAHLEKGYALLAEANNTATDKHLEILTVDNRMKQAAIGAGILPADGKPDEEQSLQFAQFQQTIDMKVRQFEQTDLQGKRKANSQELQNIVDTTLMDKAFVAESFWPDNAKPLSLMTPQEQAVSYVNVGDEEIAVTSIPVSQRALIVSKLQARGLPVTEQAIAELWVRAGKQK
jgi:soluble lytic murein transglycosylase